MSKFFELRGPPLLRPIGFLLIGIPFTLCGTILLWNLFTLSQPPFLLWLSTLLFTAAGIPLIGIGYCHHRNAKKIARRRQENPRKPWLWFDTWRADTIASRLPAKTIQLIIMAIFWNALSAPILFPFVEQLQRSTDIAFMLAVLPLTGIVLAYLALSKWLGSRKLGTTQLRLITNPGVIGGMLLARFLLDKMPHEERQLIARLEAVQRKAVSDQRRKVILESLLFSEEQVLNIARDETSGELDFSAPVAIQIPYSCRETQVSGETIQVHWKLSIVELPAAFLPLTLEFPVPVFKTEESSPTIKERPADHTAMAAAFDSGLLAQSGIKIEPLADGSLVIDFPSGRHLGQILGLFSGSGMFFILGYYLIGLNNLPMMPGLFVCLIGLIFFFAGLYFSMSSMKLHVSATGIHRQRSRLGHTKRDFIAKQDIQSVEFCAGQAMRSKIAYKVEALKNDGDRVDLGNHIKAKESARVIKSFISQALGINP